MDTVTKTTIDAANLLLKELFKTQKLQVIENKKADKTTSAGKPKSKEKEDEANKRQEIYIPQKKDSK